MMQNEARSPARLPVKGASLRAVTNNTFVGSAWTFTSTILLQYSAVVVGRWRSGRRVHEVHEGARGPGVLEGICHVKLGIVVCEW